MWPVPPPPERHDDDSSELNEPADSKCRITGSAHFHAWLGKSQADELGLAEHILSRAARNSSCAASMNPRGDLVFTMAASHEIGAAYRPRECGDTRPGREYPTITK